ncbi:MAG: hypothetical protein OEV44_11800 [Spirochaetota bacterium]|nr:hypothetical protein [Spirochaetota bacterium]
MRRIIFRILLVFICSLLQIQVLSKLTFYLGLEHAKIDIILILTLYFGYKGGVMMGQSVGFFGGLLEDIFLANIAPVNIIASKSRDFGINMFSKTLIGFTIGKIHTRIYADSFINIYILTAAGTAVNGIIYIILQVLINSYTLSDVYNYFLYTLLIEILLNSLLAPFIFKLLNKFKLTIEKDF